MQAPIMILNQNTKRESGRKAQLGNIAAAKAVADVIRTTLGPRSMLKMILDPMGGIVMTNDGNAILREIDVSHPAAKSMIELSRTQDEEVGDGTTSVIIVAGELLKLAQPFLARNMHPKNIVIAYIRALECALKALDDIAIEVDITDRVQMLNICRSVVGTKFVSHFGDLVCNLALDAVTKIVITRPNGIKEIDVKRYVRVEKIPGGHLDDSRVLDGIILNKDVVNSEMSRMIKNPRILLLDCPMEFKKAESTTNLEITKEEDWEKILHHEEKFIEDMCNKIIALKPDLVFTEKGVSDLAQHYLMKANITVIRRLRKTDNNRIARAVGATICGAADDVRESDIGKGCGLFEVKKIGDEYFTYLVECTEPKACSIILRGASKDILNEIERNLMDAMHVVRNIVRDNRVVAGGGASEMAIGRAIAAHAKTIEGVQQWPFREVAVALEVVPRTLIENCGASVIRELTALRAKHAESPTNFNYGINGETGEITDMTTLHIYDSFAVKSQTLKTAIESAAMLLRIDDIVSGMTTKQGGGGGQGPAQGGGDGDDSATFGDARDG